MENGNAEVLPAAVEQKNIPTAQELQILNDNLQIIEKREALFRRVLATALSATTQSDWTNQGTKPYLQASGALKIARRFAINIYDTVITREELEDERGKYYMYTVTGKASFPGLREYVESLGTCSSRDKFFGMKDGKLKALQDVDMGNIKKKAHTNFQGNAVKDLLGLDNMTWEQLAGFGLNPGGSAKVNFDKGASKAETSKRTEAAAASAEQTGKPYWTSDWKGKACVHARIGKHYTAEFLMNLGMKESQKPDKKGIYTIVCNDKTDSDFVVSELNDEYEVAEKGL